MHRILITLASLTVATLIILPTQAKAVEVAFDTCENCSDNRIKANIKKHYPKVMECTEEDDGLCEDFEEGNRHYIIDRISRTGKVFLVEYNDYEVLVEEDIPSTLDRKNIQLALAMHDNINARLKSLSEHWQNQISSTPLGTSRMTSPSGARVLVCPKPTSTFDMTVYTALYNAEIASQMHSDIRDFLTPENGFLDGVVQSVQIGLNIYSQAQLGITYQTMAKGRIVEAKLSNGGILVYRLTADVNFHNETIMKGEVDLGHSYDSEGIALNTRFVTKSGGGFGLHPSYTTQTIKDPCLAQEYQRVRNAISSKHIESGISDMANELDHDTCSAQLSGFTAEYKVVWTGVHGDTRPRTMFLGFTQDDEQDDDGIEDEC